MGGPGRADVEVEVRRAGCEAAGREENWFVKSISVASVSLSVLEVV